MRRHRLCLVMARGARAAPLRLPAAAARAVARDARGRRGRMRRRPPRPPRPLGTPRYRPALGASAPHHACLAGLGSSVWGGQLCQGSQRVPGVLSYRDSPPKSPQPPPANPSGVGGLTWEAWNRSAVRRYIKLRARPEPYPNPTLTLTPALLCPPPHHHPNPEQVQQAAPAARGRALLRRAALRRTGPCLAGASNGRWSGRA